jgi:4-hydroxy-3-polyprenylbenzoate decarboxylase
MPQSTLAIEAPSPAAAAASLDLRRFIDLLSREGLLRRISQAVDWKYELGEITRGNQVPLLFENVKGYPGHRIFTNGLAVFEAMALALGHDARQSRRSVMRSVRKAITEPVKPILATGGPVLENIVDGDEIDLLQLPVPQWSREEAGRYIGTWHVNVTRDPETRVRNLGIYRMQILSRNRTTVSTSPRSHLSLHLAQAEKEGRPLEMAVVIGASEPVIMAAASACPYGLDEYELAGSLSGEAVPLIKCGTVDLEVPANAEIVIEGLIQPGERAKDGPYFDYAGTPNTNPGAYVFQATRLMFRNRPIFRGSAIGRPGAEDQQLFAVLAELGLLDFHGSRARHAVQKCLIRKRLFRAFQLAGRI